MAFWRMCIAKGYVSFLKRLCCPLLRTMGFIQLDPLLRGAGNTPYPTYHLVFLNTPPYLFLQIGALTYEAYSFAVHLQQHFT